MQTRSAGYNQEGSAKSKSEPKSMGETRSEGTAKSKPKPKSTGKTHPRSTPFEGAESAGGGSTPE